MKLLVLCTILLSLAAASAQAGFSAVNDNPYERSHEQILEDVYGGNFVMSGNDFTNGTVTATRVDDSNDKTFGTGWTMRKIADESAYDSMLSQDADGSFSLQVAQTGRNYSSDMTPTDQFVTYQLNGLAGVNNAMLIFAEDLSAGDFDYNDLVVEASGGSMNAPAIAVPLPIAAWTGLAGLGVAGLVARRRKAS